MRFFDDTTLKTHVCTLPRVNKYLPMSKSVRFAANPLSLRGSATVDSVCIVFFHLEVSTWSNPRESKTLIVSITRVFDVI